MLNQSTIIFMGFIGIFLLLILGKAIQMYLRKTGAIRRTEFAPHTEFVAVIVPDMTTNNISTRLPSYYSHIDTTQVLQVQPDTVNSNSQRGRSHEWAQRAQEANFRPPVFHIALAMPTPALTTEEEAPPKYDELKFH